MKKSELKSGILVKIVDITGDKSQDCLYMIIGDYMFGESGYDELKNYNKDTLKSDYFEISEVRRISRDRIYLLRPNYSMQSKWDSADVLWKRKEVKEMTLAEISKELGYEIKIVKDK